MAKDWGEITPTERGWKWPFAQMQVGDFFRVAPELRSIGKIRNLAKSRGYDLGISFSVTVDREDGCTVVRRVDRSHQGTELAGETMPYMRFLDRMKSLYDMEPAQVDGMQIDWSFTEFGPEHFYPLKRVRPVSEYWFKAQLGSFFYAIRFEADGIRYRQLDDPLEEISL